MLKSLNTVMTSLETATPEACFWKQKGGRDRATEVLSLCRCYWDPTASFRVLIKGVVKISFGAGLYLGLVFEPGLN